MIFDHSIMELEEKWLSRVISQIGLQLEKGIEAAGELRKNTMDLQMSMWDHVNPTPGDLDDLANIWQFQTDLVREGRKALFLSSRVSRLERMRKSPYFARIDFREEGEEAVENIYIGISSIKEDKTSEILVYDWRAPICGIFYDFELGRASYVCPAGEITGEVSLKRQYRIWNGELRFLFDSSIAIRDDILQEILGKSADSKMKTIVTSIQREQNRVIRDDSHRMLLVTGPAGSGKTSVALHRAAYLLYRYREELSAENVAIFSPNDIFSEYISEVLPELGEENINRTTFQEYARRILGDDAILESQSRQLEYLLTHGDNTGMAQERIVNIQYKSSMRMIEDLCRYAAFVEENRKFVDVSFRGQMIETGDEISNYFREELKFLPVTKRLDKIRSRLTAKLDELIRPRVEEVVLEVAKTGEYPNPAEIRGRSIFIVRGEAAEAKVRIEEMSSLSLLDCYMGFAPFLSMPEIITGYGKQDAAESQAYIYYEDIAPILLLNGLLSGFPDMGAIRQVIIDEVQDYAPVQFEIFRRLFRTSRMTLLGDPNQAVCPHIDPLAGEEILNLFQTGASAYVRLEKSYRSTRQISNFCNAIKGRDATGETMNRDGEQPLVICPDSRAELFRMAAEDMKALKREGMKSIGVILRTENDCRQAFEFLSVHSDITLITAERQEFFTGAVLIPSYLSKGLEFDAVLALCMDPTCYGKPEESGLAYTVCSRALHRLHIYCPDEVPVFIRDIDNSFYELLR